MKKTTLFSLFALLLIVGSISIASAYRGDYKGPNYNEERHELMETAFESGDYDAWYGIMSEDGRHPRVLDVVTEENFETFAKAHNAQINGDSKTALQLRAELGLGNGQGMHRGMNGGMHHGQGMNKRMGEMNFVDADGDGTCDNLQN